MHDDAIEELDYLVTADDIAYLNHYHTQKSPAFQRRRRTAGVMCITFGVCGFLTALTLGGVALSFMALVILTGVWLTLGKRDKPSPRQIKQIKQIYGEGQNRALFGHHHVRLLADRIEVTTEFSRGEVKWAGVEKIAQDEHYVFIYVSALNAYVIHKRYFPSEAQSARFVQVAERLHAGALQLQGSASHEQRALPAPIASEDALRREPRRRAPKALLTSAPAGETDGSL